MGKGGTGTKRIAKVRTVKNWIIQCTRKEEVFSSAERGREKKKKPVKIE